MAQRRMFSLKIVDQDDFLNMGIGARLLYYDLGMRADDDGFIGGPKRIMRMTGASEDDLKILIAKKFIIPFESGVCVIRDWRVHNYIQADRYQETHYTDEKKQLEITENNTYKLAGLKSECTQNVYKMDTQVRLGKNRIGKNRIGKINSDADEDLFYELWDIEPNKTDKARAITNYKKALKIKSHAELKTAWEKYVTWAKNEYKDNKYITRLANWLGEKKGYLNEIQETAEWKTDTMGDRHNERRIYTCIYWTDPPDDWTPPDDWEQIKRNKWPDIIQGARQMNWNIKGPDYREALK